MFYFYSTFAFVLCRHLGENVNGLTNLVGQVYKYLQTKVDREDIRNLISSKLMQMEQELIYREEEMLSAAGTAAHAARCISCGQLPAVTRPRTTQPTAQRSGITSPQTGLSGKFVDEDNLGRDSPPLNSSNVIVTSTPLTNSSAFSLQNNEQVYSLLTGQVGLRPLHLQHNPLQPRDALNNNNNNAGNNVNSSATNGMHSSRPHTVATNRVKPQGADKIPEPLYRKARMAAHMKEMVKVSAPAMDSYGYNSGANPFYITDTSSSLNAPAHGSAYSGGKIFHPTEQQPSLTTLHNTFGNGGFHTGGNGLRGAGAHIIGSQSLTSLRSGKSPLDQPLSILSTSSRDSNGSKQVSSVNIDAHNLGDMNRTSAF